MKQSLSIERNNDPINSNKVDQKYQNLELQTLLTFRKAKSSVQDEFTSDKSITIDKQIDTKQLKVNLKKLKQKFAPEVAYDLQQAISKKKLKRCSSRNEQFTINQTAGSAADPVRCPSSRRNKKDSHRSCNRESSRGRHTYPDNPYCEVRGPKSNRYNRYRAYNSKQKDKEFNSSSAVKYFQNEILINNCKRIKNLWYRKKLSETYCLRAEECMPVIEFNSSLISSVFKMHHRQIDEIQHKPYSLDIFSETIDEDNFDHINFSYIKNNLSIQTGRFRDENSTVNSKFEIYPEKCRQIPALEFKNMCVEHFAKIKQIKKDVHFGADVPNFNPLNNPIKKYMNVYDMILCICYISSINIKSIFLTKICCLKSKALKNILF